jgi:O-methyltransferase
LPTIQERFSDLLDWYARMLPSRVLLPLSLPIGKQLNTNQWIRYESARMIETAFAFIHNNEVAGDYLEFGVFRGRTFTTAWDAARRYRMHDMQFYAFDSFTGLPEISNKDIGGEFHEGQFHAERATFEKTLRRHKVDLSRVKIVEGMFDETLTGERRKQLPVKKAAIVWVDCDLYTSTVPVLNFISDILVDGAVLIFDDWYCFKGSPERGEQLACTEWLESHSDIRLIEYHKFGWAGCSFIVNRRGGGGDSTDPS